MLKADNPLWHKIQKLTEIHRKFPALCASGEIEFVYCEPEKYPLVYLRSAGSSKILVAINPPAEEACCPCPYNMGEIIYSIGKGIKIENKMLHIAGESAVFMIC